MTDQDETARANAALEEALRADGQAWRLSNAGATEAIANRLQSRMYRLPDNPSLNLPFDRQRSGNMNWMPPSRYQDGPETEITPQVRGRAPRPSPTRQGLPWIAAIIAVALIALFAVLIPRLNLASKSSTSTNPTNTPGSSIQRQPTYNPAYPPGSLLYFTAPCPASGNCQATATLLQQQILKRYSPLFPSNTTYLRITVSGKIIQIDLLDPTVDTCGCVRNEVYPQGLIQFWQTPQEVAPGTMLKAGQYPVVFTNNDIDQTSVTDIAQNGIPMITAAMNANASQRFADYTKQHVGNYLTLSADGEVFESVVIQSEITGSFTIASSNIDPVVLSTFFKNGPLPVVMTLVSSTYNWPPIGYVPPTPVPYVPPTPSPTTVPPTATTVPNQPFMGATFQGNDGSGGLWSLSIEQGWAASNYSLPQFTQSYRFSDPTGQASIILLVGSTANSRPDALTTSAQVAGLEGGTNYVEIGAYPDQLAGLAGTTVSATYSKGGQSYQLTLTMVVSHGFPFAFVGIDLASDKSGYIQDSRNTLKIG